MNFKLLWTIARNDFKARFAGSYFGVVWAFVQPIVTIFIYWFVFQVAFQNTPVHNVPYVLWLVSGMIPWFFLSEAWGGATGCLTEYGYLVKKVVFQVEILPYVKIASAFFVHIFFTAFVFVMFFCYGYGLGVIHIQVFYYMSCAAVLSLALGRISCILTAFFKDMSNIVGIFIQFGFWLTPIFWRLDDLPAFLVPYFQLNPFYYVIDGYRDTFIYGTWFWEKGWVTLYFWGFTAILLIWGRSIFKKLRPHLPDVL